MGAPWVVDWVRVCRDHQSQQFVGKDLLNSVLPHPPLGAQQYPLWDFSIVVCIKVRSWDVGIIGITNKTTMSIGKN
jgi:hypothetical protein